MAMNPQNIEARWMQELTQPPRRDLTPDSVKVMRNWLEQFQPDFRALIKQYDAIQASRVLNDQGKREKWAELGTEFLRRYGWMRQELTDRDGTLARNRTDLFTMTSSETNE